MLRIPFLSQEVMVKLFTFTVKNSGDHTNNIYDNLQAGSKVSVDRAYGHMIIEEGRENQVWIAGGIGITPSSLTSVNIPF